ncbi:MAG TPA: sugar phosphate isomerase/epimerase family protein [Bryobacteraceae bacterium]|nr:sugar phosphate isomerase/epimerase family protein [Bryobacteraceae bacterium]
MLTRRTFVQAIAAGIGAGCALAANKLNIGIGTYTYHTYLFDDMVAQLTALKIREIEMSRGEFMLMKPPTDQMCIDAKRKLDNAGIRCVSYYSATIKTDHDLDLAVRFAGLLGARNISGDATGDILARIDDRLTKEGLTFGIHNHYFKGGFAYESPEDVLKALAGRSKTMGSTLDVGHIASCGHDTVDAVRKLGPFLKMVHLKDVKASGGEDNVPLGQGISKIPQVMAELHKISYRGLCAIEYEKEGNIDEVVAEEVAYARKLA